MIGSRKAQSFLEYSLLVAVLVGGLLLSGSYIRRSLQGQIQQTGDSMASQYEQGLVYSDESFETEQKVVELTIPGFGAPNNIIWTRSSHEAQNKRELLPLEESLSFGR